MFECTLEHGELFKKIVAALSDLVSEGNFMIDATRISFQGMDSSHVSLCALSLNADGFNPYRCDRDITLGINFSSLNKILKCMTSKDQLSIRANDDADSVFFIFASENDKRVSNFELKLMDIDAEQLGIPDTEYSTTIKMPSSEFQRICRDLAAIGDSVMISVNKQGVKFSVSGDIGSGDMILQGRMTRRKKKKNNDEGVNNDNDNDIDNNNDNNNDNDEKEVADNNNTKVKNESTPGNEDSKNAVTQDIDGDEAMNDKENEEEANEDVDIQEETKHDNDEQDNNEMEEDVYEDDADVDEKKQIVIELNEPVQQTFALRYLNNFTKATTLSDQVTLSMGGEVPLMVEYKMKQLGYIRYYLAPKIDDDE